MLAYVGPDVMLPAASAAAAILGGVLFAWRWIAASFSRMWGWICGRRETPNETAPGTTAGAPTIAGQSRHVDPAHTPAPRTASAPER